jgi:hypothetical protein
VSQKSWASLSGPALLVSALIIAAVMTLAACAAPATGRVTVAPVDILTYAPCDHEDGSGDGQTYPCVWDSAHRGVPNAPYVGYAYVLYVSGPCPAPGEIVQDVATVRCLDIREWMNE